MEEVVRQLVARDNGAGDVEYKRDDMSLLTFVKTLLGKLVRPFVLVDISESCLSFLSTEGCNYHGNCKDDTTGPQCVCEPGYEGTNCQTREYYRIHLPYPLLVDNSSKYN